MTVEAVMLSLAGTVVRESACDFSVSQTAADVVRDVSNLRETLLRAFDRLARKQPVGPVGELVRRLKH